jgi:hypothetical protein
MTEAITSGPELELISMAGRAMEALAAVEVMRLETLGALAVALDIFTLCSTLLGPAALGGGAVNLSFSFLPWTTWTTRRVAPPIRRTWTRRLRTKKLPLQAIQRCQRLSFRGCGSEGATWRSAGLA